LDILKFYIFSLDPMPLFKVIVGARVKIKYQINRGNKPMQANNIKAEFGLD